MNISERLLYKIEDLFKKCGSYNFLLNNCQHFSIKIVNIFGLKDLIIFKKCTIVNKRGYYTKEPNFTEQYLLNGEVSIYQEFSETLEPISPIKTNEHSVHKETKNSPFLAI